MTTLPRLGCLPPHPSSHPVHTVRLALYLDSELPPPPPVFEPSPRATFRAFGNDYAGDCAVAAVANVDCAVDPEGSIYIATSDVLAIYTEVTGYDPEDPSTDNGAILSDVLAACHTSAIGGLGGHVLTAFAEMDHADVYKLHQAVSTPGLGVVIGLRMPNAAKGAARWEGPLTDEGDDAPGSWGGHAVALVGYHLERDVWTVVSWGEEIEMEDSFLAAYCNEAWCLVDGEAPGVDVARLRADLARLAGGAA